MRKILALGLLVVPAVVGMSWVSDAAAAASARWQCVLSGLQEVPANASTALGGGTFVLDTDANTLSYRIAFSGLTAAESAAHIHGAALPGVNAGVAHALPAGNPKVGVWNYPEASEASILGGLMYVNIHSAAFPGGEIRGQIVNMNASLDAGQEVPPVASPGAGFGLFMIDTTANTLSYHIVFGGLTAAETAAHIHGFSLHGTSSGVIHALPAGSPKVGTYNYPEAQEEAILNGRAYVNIHSAAFAGGEIRGQIVPIVVPMDKNQEVPPTASPGAGVGLISYDPDANNLSYDIRTAGLAGTESAAHIHGFSAPGVNSGVQHGLPGGTPKRGVWAYGAANEQAIFAGLTYINIHSSVNPGGEIRGQIEGFFGLVPADAPEVVALAPRISQSIPNPFQDATSIHFRLDQASDVTLAIYDSQGRLVRDLATGDFAQGAHSVRWDGNDNSGRAVASGVYRYVLQTGQGEDAGRLTLVR